MLPAAHLLRRGPHSRPFRLRPKGAEAIACGEIPLWRCAFVAILSRLGDNDFSPASLEARHCRLTRFGAAMLFCDRLSEQQVTEAKAANREKCLEALLSDFRKAFPELTFELQLDFTIINAQALKLQDRLIVMIYGGLALHPKLGAESLTFIILHEAGHHFARGCRSRRDPSLSCECASDYWAVTVGTDTLLQRSGRHLRMRVALEELNQVMSSGHPSKGSYTRKRKTSTSGCWSRAWSLRSRALFERTRPPTIEGCCVTYI